MGRNASVNGTSTCRPSRPSRARATRDGTSTMRIADGDCGDTSETQTGESNGNRNKLLTKSYRAGSHTNATSVSSTSSKTTAVHFSTPVRLTAADDHDISASGSVRNFISLDVVSTDALTNADALTTQLVIRPWREGSSRTTGQVLSLCP